MEKATTLGTTGRPIRIMIVEDQIMLANFLVEWAGKQKCLELVGCAKNGAEALAICGEFKPDVALVDIELPDWDGLDLGKELLQRSPALRVLSMSGRTDPFTIWRVQESGLHGFVDKGQNPALLMKAVLAVAAHETYFSAEYDKVKKERLGESEAFHKILSDREQAVLQCVAGGQSDAMIAENLAIAVATVAMHRKNIRQKLEVHSDRELMAYARRWGVHKATA